MVYMYNAVSYTLLYNSNLPPNAVLICPSNARLLVLGHLVGEALSCPVYTVSHALLYLYTPSIAISLPFHSQNLHLAQLSRT